MKGENRSTQTATMETKLGHQSLHPAWGAFIRYCTQLQHGEIELLKIQDGVPVLAEAVKKKIKFAR